LLMNVATVYTILALQGRKSQACLRLDVMWVN
jgi:hypothetical protein